MILAPIVLLCLAASVLTAAAVKRHALHPWLAVPIVTGLPLAGWLLLQLTAQPARSPLEFEVLGQYHRLSDTLRIGTRPDADVVLRDVPLPEADLALAFDPATRQLHVTVKRAVAPILLGEQPVNAIALGRRAVLTASDGTTRVIVRPWYCWRCDARYVQSPTGTDRVEIRLDAAPRLTLGDDTVHLFRIGRTAYAAADPRSGVRVNQQPIPTTAAGTGDTLFIGWPPAERLLIRPLPAEHRLDVLFTPTSSRRSVLPRAAGDTLRLLVSATTAAPLPGNMAVLDPAAAAPGAAAQPYGGVLALHDGEWSWLSAGVTRRLAAGVPQLLPGPAPERAAGHIVRIRQYDTDPGAARGAVIVAWVLGALALAWLWRYLHPEALALRTLLLGAVYTLVAVRGVLALRAWLAPPYDASSVQTLIAVLIALPALTAALHLWTQWSTGRLQRRQFWREAAACAAPLVLAAVLVVLLVLPGWRAAVLNTAVASVASAIAGLVLLNRLLLRGHAGALRVEEPLSAVTAPPQQGYTHRQFLSALVVLGMLGFLLLVVNQLLRYGALLALVAWAAIVGAALFATAGPRVLVRPRSSSRPMLVAGPAGVAAGAVAWALGLGVVIALLALVSVGALAFTVRARPTLRIRSVHLRELAGPPLLLTVLVALIAIRLPGLVGAGRVVAEYALALAGLIAIARIFTILWFRHTQQLVRHPHDRSGRKRLPGYVSISAVLLLLLAIVYVPLALFDTGLVLLFFAATMTTVFLGFYTMGARGIALLAPVVVGAVFFLGMFVRPADLRDGSASLNTAQIRYAATYHPRQLQQHMLHADDGRPVSTVRTLQQYWGIRHYAAAGTAGRGYFGAAYADWIVPRPVALTENAFSTFLLSEHGWLGGTAVLLCYLAIALALLYGAIRACSRTAAAPRALLLVGIAAFWIVPAFYIAAANGVLLPLTGQNMPLLGLLSSADVALACWLTAFGLTALPIDSASGTEHVRSAGWLARLRAGVAIAGAGFVAAAAVLAVMLWRPAHAQVGDFALDGVIAGVESLVQQGVLQAAPTAGGADTVAISATAAAHPMLLRGGFLRSRIHRANRIARGEPPGAGCLDSDPLVRARSDGSVAVFTSLCSLRAVVEGRQEWAGTLRTDAGQPEFVLSDGRAAVVLDPLQPGVAVLGGACARPGTSRARAVRIGCGDGSAVVRFGTSAPVLEQVGSPRLELNGSAATAPALIRHGDHLRVSGAADVWALELPSGALMYARWENATTRRIADHYVTPWLAQLDSLLARGLAYPERATWDALVTLQPQAHRELQTSLAAACSTIARVRRCSALLADPFTGEIIALSATGTQPHRYLSADANLRNHPAASAIKPIMTAAALQAYPQLRTLEVEHDGGEFSTVANTSVHPPIRAARSYPAPRVPLRGYLGASDNLYAATLGFLATSARGDDGAPALRGNSDVSQLRLNGRPLRGQPSWVASGGRRLDLSVSPFATALRELYGVHVDSGATPPYDRSFWDASVKTGAIPSSSVTQRITPEPVSLDMNGFASPRELAAFMIGGDGNRWNNVALVQALSRIYSGRAVELHVLRSVGPHSLASQPGGFAGTDLTRRVVLDAMAAVTGEPWGTAYPLRNAFPSSVHWRAKTGTLNEREWVGSVFLFAGEPGGRGRGECAAAGVITVELERDGNPDGRATAVFHDAVAPLLRRTLGWGDTGCTRHGSAQ
jgi:cell division protein FtsW (lipid II flippase)